MLGWAKLHEKNGLQWQKMFRTGGFLQVGQTGAATSFSFFNPYITYQQKHMLLLLNMAVFTLSEFSPVGEAVQTAAAGLLAPLV